MASRQRQKQKQASPLDRTRKMITQARSRMHRSPFSALLTKAQIIECRGVESDPAIACVDAMLGYIWLNPHRNLTLKAEHWTFILAHMLSHIGLDHENRRGQRDAAQWNIACDFAADALAISFGLGRPPDSHLNSGLFSGQTEEEIYERLYDFSREEMSLDTYSGKSRLDLVKTEGEAHISRFAYQNQKRPNWQSLLAAGIREHVIETVEDVADTLGMADASRRDVWLPGENARRWVIQNFPLLGAVAAQMRIIANNAMCDRYDISVAAVDGYLGEIYFRTNHDFSPAEIIFIYCHELLHAALLHHSRGRGRDPWLWNVACDFVINDWLIQMGVGQTPSIGLLYDPRLTGMSSDEVYDLLLREPGRCKNARGFRGALGDVLIDTANQRIYRGDVSTLDDVLKRCLSHGYSLMARGTLPAGLEEEIRTLYSPPPPWDVELARWMENHVPIVRESLRSYARASRRQASTPDIPRPARYVPQEWKDACTFGVVLDTSGSMDRELLGRALGAIASYADARDVPQVRLVFCDAAPYDHGYIAPQDLRSAVSIKGRGGTELQPAVNYLQRQADFPPGAPIMIITDGWCEEEILCSREHCFVLPRKSWKEGAMLLRTSAPVFRILKEEHFE